MRFVIRSMAVTITSFNARFCELIISSLSATTSTLDFRAEKYKENFSHIFLYLSVSSP